MYTEAGYIDFDYIMKDPNVFKFIIGGRGSGKTYGAIKWALDNGKTMMFMRRTQTQIDLIRNDAFSPFAAVDKNIMVKSINKNLAGLYREENGAPFGYMCALSTISNIRGFDASEVDLIIYDEFIGEAHERAIRHEGEAFLNAYETINRNRELQGRPAVQVLALANSNQLANPIFVELNLVSPVERMLKNGNVFYKNFQRNVSVYMVNHSPVLDQKERTALYQLSGDSDFAKMALKNRFTTEEMDHIAPQDLRQYKLACVVGEICIYKHKSLKIYYVTDHRAGSTENTYSSGQMDLKRFRRDMYHFWLAYLNGKILFESYIFKVLFERYFNFN